MEKGRRGGSAGDRVRKMYSQLLPPVMTRPRIKPHQGRPRRQEVHFRGLLPAGAGLLLFIGTSALAKPLPEQAPPLPDGLYGATGTMFNGSYRAVASKGLRTCIVQVNFALSGEGVQPKVVTSSLHRRNDRYYLYGKDFPIEILQDDEMDRAQESAYPAQRAAATASFSDNYLRAEWIWRDADFRGLRDGLLSDLGRCLTTTEGFRTSRPIDRRQP